MELIRKNKNIMIFDNVLNTDEHNKLYSNITQLWDYGLFDIICKPHGDKSRDNYPTPFPHITITDKTISESITKKMNDLITSYYSGEDLELYQIYGNVYTAGMQGTIHNDIGNLNISNSKTIVYYLHKEWDVEWGGQTYFYDDNYEIIDGVVPYSNRLILFNDVGVKHGVSPISNRCIYKRMILTFKYVDKKNASILKKYNQVKSTEKFC
tara:strand:+ start:107 stop:736 length:630 start_codon:yes stop_codon:yes gene_type:complete